MRTVLVITLCVGFALAGERKTREALRSKRGERRQIVGCVFNGQVYLQGQTWREGCKLSCTCVDGSSRKYQCQELCVLWYLPWDQCTLNPSAAGKCCSTPNCPAGFNIQYPPGYVAN